VEKVYNKLVRDKIPEIIKKNGEPIIRTLDDNEFKQELEKKLYEEYLEVLEATTTEEKIEELADMLEIVSALSKLENKNLKDVIEVAKQKQEKRGGFARKIYLEKVIEPDNQ